MWARLHPRARAGAVWLMNVDCEPQLDFLNTVVKNVAGTENVGGYANKVYDAEKRTIKGRPIVTTSSSARRSARRATSCSRTSAGTPRARVARHRADDLDPPPLRLRRDGVPLHVRAGRPAVARLGAHAVQGREHALVPSSISRPGNAAGRTGRTSRSRATPARSWSRTSTRATANTVALTPNQATAVAGTGAKAINAVPIWAISTPRRTTPSREQTDAASYTTDAAVKIKMVMFQIDAAALDVNGGFDCITLLTGASNAGNITSAIAILTGARFQQVTPPTAVVD
jgi:hypothetical protein